MTLLPKNESLRCRAYLDWLRLQPCQHCGRTPYPPHSYSEPSHAGFRGTALKAPDNLASSACHTCHARHHSKESRHHPKYDKLTRVEYRERLAELGREQWMRYLSEHPKENEKYAEHRVRPNQ